MARRNTVFIGEDVENVFTGESIVNALYRLGIDHYTPFEVRLGVAGLGTAEISQDGAPSSLSRR